MTGEVRGRLTEAEKALIESLAARNWPPGRVATKLNRIRQTVHFYMVMNGLYKPRPIVIAPFYQRSGHLVVGFTADEDAFIERLRAEGCALKTIADRAAQQFSRRRRPDTIRIRLIMLASRAAMAA